MKKPLAIILLFGFLAVDFLFFHDMFKPGETITTAQYLVGFLSLPVIVIAVQSLLKVAPKSRLPS